MSLNFRFSKSDRVTISAETFRFLKQNQEGDQYYFRNVDDKNSIKIVATEELIPLMRSSAWRYEPRYFYTNKRAKANIGFFSCLPSLMRKKQSLT